MSVKKLSNAMVIDIGSYGKYEKENVRTYQIENLKKALLREADKYINIEQVPSLLPHEERFVATIFVGSEEDYRRGMGRHEEGPTPAQQLQMLKDNLIGLFHSLENEKWLGPNDVKAIKEKLNSLSK